MVERFNEKQKLMFNAEFYKLSVRAINILYSLRIRDIDSFVTFIIENNKIAELNKIRNCGVKTTNEIDTFKNKVLSILSETSTETFSQIIKNDINTDQETINPQTLNSASFNGRIKFLFDLEFDKLNIRAQNILEKIKANQLEGFVAEVINNKVDLIDIRNCGEKTKAELEFFKNTILNKILHREESLTPPKLFEDLDIYFRERNVLSKVELYIFSNHHAFINDSSFEPLSLIAQKTLLTKERIRQISMRLFEKIIKIIKNVYSKGEYLIEHYFQAEAFTVSESLTNSVNKKENTNFSPAFVTIVLSQINNEDYDFIPTANNLRSYSGIFIKRSLQIYYKKCFEYLITYLNSRREKDLVFTFDDLIKLFSIGENPQLNIGVQIDIESKRKNVYDILTQIIKAIPSTHNQIELRSDSLIMRRNTKKFIHEYLVDILNTYKKPMHFSQLYEECLQRSIKVGSDASVHSTMVRYPGLFGIKGPGIYGLIEWGGYFGTIGDVTEKILKERNQPIERKELETILCQELYISQDSILNVLLRYEHEKRFVLLKNNKISLKEWT